MLKEDTTRVMSRAVRTLMDLTYLARYKSHTATDTILKMRDCLKKFHDNKSICIDLGIWETSSLPKLHSLSHYASSTSSIQLFQLIWHHRQLQCRQTERLHRNIGFAKDAYRATNHKDEYSQMTRWLERRELSGKLIELLSIVSR